MRPEKPTLSRMQSRHFRPLDIDINSHLSQEEQNKREQLKPKNNNVDAGLTAKKEDKQQIPGGINKGKSFAISETTLQKKSLSLKEKEKISSGIQQKLRNVEERDDEGFPREDDLTVDIYIFQGNEGLQENQDGFKKDSEGFVIPKLIPRKPPTISQSLDQKTHQKKSTGQPGKRERAPDIRTKERPTMPPPKKQKTSNTQFTPGQNLQKKPQVQRPTS